MKGTKPQLATENYFTYLSTGNYFIHPTSKNSSSQSKPLQKQTKFKRCSMQPFAITKYFQIFAWISLGVVLISTFTFVLGTFPEFQKEEDTGQPPPYPEAVLVMDIVGRNRFSSLLSTPHHISTMLLTSNICHNPSPKSKVNRTWSDSILLLI